MNYGEAFQKLGYRLAAPRTDWTAVKDEGICITLWRNEIDWSSLTLDTRIHCGPSELWNAAGNRKRITHLQQAISKFDGWVDAVIVDGIPGQGVSKASPWNPNERQGLKWRITNLEDGTGHFIARALKG